MPKSKEWSLRLKSVRCNKKEDYMNMKIVKSEIRLCPCCMERHEVKTVLVEEHITFFKDKAVDYEASYMFCDLAREFYMDEQQMQDNDIKIRDAYRKIKSGDISKT